MRRVLPLLAVGAVLVATAAAVPPAPRPVGGPGWAVATVAPGAHSASVTVGPQAPRPLAGLTRVAGRTYHLALGPSARYVLTDPVEPEDQLDWNKLPGLSDCGDVDLSVNGVMFAWRWRTDLEPRVLELTAYANNDGVHLTAPAPMLTLTREQVDASRPVWYRLRISNDRRQYEFTIRARLGGVDVTRSARLPRACPTRPRDVTKWASGLYFGGTSPAPQRIRAAVYEP